MNPLASLDPRDRSLVKVFLVLVFLLIVLLAVFTPRADDDKNLLPGSNLTGKHGAKAAFTLLAESGYQITRWEEPLSNLADHAGPDTVLILANPITQQLEDERAVRAIACLGDGGAKLLRVPDEDKSLAAKPGVRRGEVRLKRANLRVHGTLHRVTGP